jgi:hypothetical protein
MAEKNRLALHGMELHSVVLQTFLDNCIRIGSSLSRGPDSTSSKYILRAMFCFAFELRYYVIGISVSILLDIPP